MVNCIQDYDLEVPRNRQDKSRLSKNLRSEITSRRRAKKPELPKKKLKKETQPSSENLNVAWTVAPVQNAAENRLENPDSVSGYEDQRYNGCL